MNSFFRSILTLATGSVLAQLMTIIASPILTRLYSTEEIGLYTLIITAVSMFGGVVCGRYDMSIVSVKDRDDALALIKLSFILCAIFSLLISIGYSMYYYFLGQANISNLMVFIVIFLLLFANGITNILTSFNNRKREYNLITSVQVLKSFGRNSIMVVSGLLSLGSIGLMLSQVIGQFLGLNRQAKSLKSYLRQIINIGNTDLVRVAKSNYKQPIFSVPAIFANNFSYSSINLFIGSLFGLTTLAYYAMSFRMLGLPLNVVSINVSKVYFEEASREYNATNQYRKPFLKTSLFLLIIAIPMVSFMYFLAPSLFGWLFGEGWEVAGHYVSILSPMFGIRFIVSALSIGMIISKKQNIELIINLLFLTASIVLFFITRINSYNIEQYLYSISISYAIIYLGYYFMLYRYSTKS